MDAALIISIIALIIAVPVAIRDLIPAAMDIYELICRYRTNRALTKPGHQVRLRSTNAEEPWRQAVRDTWPKNK